MSKCSSLALASTSTSKVATCCVDLWSMDAHEKAVEGLSEKLKKLSDSRIPSRMYHGDTMSTRLSTRRSDRVIDTRRLNKVINIDAAARIATVEPSVSFEMLISETLKEGLIPQVVPSFPSITVGGAFVGTAAQSSSVTAGFFENTIEFVEVIIGNGAIVKATEEGQNKGLLRDLRGSCGTLGVVTLLGVRLMKARTYVELEYIPIYSAQQALEVLERSQKGLDFSYLDALLFSDKVGVVMVGRLTNYPEVLQTTVKFRRAKDNWFYLHAHSQIPHSTACATCPFSPPGCEDMDGRHARDLIPLEDYLFRYDRGNMWMGIYGQDPKSFGDMSRWIIDWMARTKNMYRAVHHSGQSQSFIVQDVTLPFERGLELLSWLHQNLRIYPTWLCPIASSDSSPQRPFRARQNGMLLNVNVWGSPAGLNQSEQELPESEAYLRFVESNRTLEAKISQVEGFKWPYGQYYHTEDEFWSGYDRAALEVSRREWHAQGLPTLWDKMKNEHRGYVDKGWLPKALFKTIFGVDHLLDQSRGKERWKKKPH